MSDLARLEVAARHLPPFPRAIRATFDSAHVVDGRTLVNGADRFVILPCGDVWHVVARDGVLRGYMYRNGREVARMS